MNRKFRLTYKKNDRRDQLKSLSIGVVFVVICFICLNQSIRAQTTAFTYQGRLLDGGAPATGQYDLTFKLYDLAAGGTQIGSNIVVNDAQVTAGNFTVTLDFGVLPFTTATANYLEISVRPGASSGAFTLLSPRQPVTSAPYSVRSLNADTAANAATATNAAQLGGVAANQFVVTTDPRMTDARTPTAGSTNYIQNTASQQAASNFNVSGTGTANILNAASQFNIGGNRVLSLSGTNNLFAGINAGGANTTGSANSFFGFAAGFVNTTGGSNSFFGFNAGRFNTIGNNNSFFGTSAGTLNTSGGFNSFFGVDAGTANTTGGGNSFFGSSAGTSNTTGELNAFFGFNAGYNNTTGTNNAFFGFSGDTNTTGSGNSFFGTGVGTGNTTGNSNSFFGYTSGTGNTTGSSNTIIGYSANVGANNLTNATAVGANSLVAQSNSLVLGSISGVGGATANTNVGIGTTTPGFRLDVVGRGRIKQAAGQTGVIESAGFWLFQNAPNTERAFIGMETDNTVGFFGNNGGGWSFLMNTQTGVVKVANLGAAGSTQLCRNASNEISTCSSSLRYKTNIGEFSPGLAFVKRLRPISFEWKDGGIKDVGFGAEDVAKIDPRFVTYNAAGEVEGVKYDRVGVVLVNAVQEQQKQIEAQAKEIATLKTEIELLKAAVCREKPLLEVCKPQP